MTLTRDRAEAALGAKQAAGAPGKMLWAWGGQRWGSARLRDAGIGQGKGPQRGWGCCAGASEALGPLGGAAKSPAAGSSPAVCQALSLHRHLSGVIGGSVKQPPALRAEGMGVFYMGVFYMGLYLCCLLHIV